MGGVRATLCVERGRERGGLSESNSDFIVYMLLFTQYMLRCVLA